MIYYIEKSGRKRKGIEKACPVCHNLFVTRLDQEGTYCSKQCCSDSRKNKVQLQCDCCDKLFYRHPSALSCSKSGFYFCSRECKDKSQRLGGIEEIMPSHYGSFQGRKSAIYRRTYKELNNIEILSCIRCGYSEFESAVDIHHIDENCNNNSIENLIALCACCHRGLHYGLWELK